MFAIQTNAPPLYLVPRAEPQPRPVLLLPAPQVVGLLPATVPLHPTVRTLERWLRRLELDWQQPLTKGYALAYPAWSEQHDVPRYELQWRGEVVDYWQVRSSHGLERIQLEIALRLWTLGVWPVGEATFIESCEWEQMDLWEVG